MDNKKFLDLDGLTRYNNKVKNKIEEVERTIEAEADTRNNSDQNLQSQINGLASGSPLAASSTAGMTDTNRIYVNTTDGHWYYYNGSAWVDGGVYQSAGIAEDYVDGENLVLNLQKSVNFEEPTITSETGVYIGRGGKKQTNGNGHVSEGIKLRKGDIILFTAKGYQNNVSLLSSYINATKNTPLVISEETKVYDVVYTATYDGTYFISSIGAGYPPSNIKIYHKNLTEPSDKYKLDYLENLLSDENSDNVVEGKYIAYNTGGTAMHGTLNCTDFIEIRPSSKLKLSSKTNLLYSNTDSAGLAFYDFNQNYISGVQYTAGTESYTLTVPNGAKYIRLTLTPTMQNVGYTLAYYDVDYTLNYLVSRQDLESKADRTTGVISNAVFIGDSLTYGQCYTASSSSYRNYYNYPYFLKKMMQIDSITEIAKGGATATSWWNSFSEQITQSNTVYFVWLGTNSTFTDTVDTDCVGDDYTQYANTETGNMGKILQKIKSLDNNRIIMLNCFASGGHAEQTNDILGKLATRFNVDLLVDTVNTDIRNSKYHTSYNGHYNAVHFNDKGNNFVANIVKEQLNDYLINNQFEMVKVHA